LSLCCGCRFFGHLAEWVNYSCPKNSLHQARCGRRSIFMPGSGTFLAAPQKSATHSAGPPRLTVRLLVGSWPPGRLSHFCIGRKKAAGAGYAAIPEPLPRALFCHGFCFYKLHRPYSLQVLPLSEIDRLCPPPQKPAPKQIPAGRDTPPTARHVSAILPASSPCKIISIDAIKEKTDARGKRSYNLPHSPGGRGRGSILILSRRFELIHFCATLC
jgi:hypothetical protein